MYRISCGEISSMVMAFLAFSITITTLRQGGRGRLWLYLLCCTYIVDKFFYAFLFFFFLRPSVVPEVVAFPFYFFVWIPYPLVLCYGSLFWIYKFKVSVERKWMVFGLWVWNGKLMTLKLIANHSPNGKLMLLQRLQDELLLS